MSDYDVIIGVDASEAERGAEAVRRSLRSIKENVGQLEGRLQSLGRSQRTITDMVARMNRVGDAVSKMQQQLAALRAPAQVIGNLTREFGVFSRQVLQSAGNLTQLRQALSNTERLFATGSAAIQNQTRKVEEAKSAYASMQNELRNLGRNASDLHDRMGRLASGFKGLSSAGVSVASLQNAMRNLGKVIGEVDGAIMGGNVSLSQMQQLIERYVAAIRRAQGVQAQFNRSAAEMASVTRTQNRTGVMYTTRVRASDAIYNSIRNAGQGSGAPDRNMMEYKQLTDYFRQLESASKKISPAAHEAANKLLEINQAAGGGKVSLRDYVKAADGVNASIRGGHKELSAFGHSVKNHHTSLGNATRSVLNHSYALRGFNGLVWSTVGAVQAFTAALGFREITQGIVKLQQFENGFRAVTGSISEGNARFTFAEDLANKYGLSLEGVARGLMRFEAAAKGSGFTQKEINGIFDNTSAAIRTLGLSSAETEGIFRAFEQMMSKGKIMAEELRLQLGDRLPGAFNIMAESMGVTTAQLDKMLEKGEVSSRHLVKFAETLRQRVDQGGALQAAINSLPAELDRLHNSFLRATGTIGEGGFTTAVTGAVRSLREFLDGASGHSVLTAFGAAVHDVVKTVTILGDNLGIVGAAIVTALGARVATALMGTASAMSLLEKAAIGVGAAFKAHPVLMAVGAVAAVTMGYVALTGGLTDTERATNALNASQKAHAEANLKVASNLKDISTAQKMANGLFTDGEKITNKYAQSLLDLGMSAQVVTNRLMQLSAIEFGKAIQKKEEELSTASKAIRSSFVGLEGDIQLQLSALARGGYSGKSGLSQYTNLINELDSALRSGKIEDHVEKIDAAMMLLKSNLSTHPQLLKNADRLYDEFFKRITLRAQKAADDIALAMTKEKYRLASGGIANSDFLGRFMELEAELDRLQAPEALKRIQQYANIGTKELDLMREALVAASKSGDLSPVANVIRQLSEWAKEATTNVKAMVRGFSDKDFLKTIESLNDRRIKAGLTPAEAIRYDYTEDLRRLEDPDKTGKQLSDKGRAQVDTYVALEGQTAAINEFKKAYDDLDKKVQARAKAEFEANKLLLAQSAQKLAQMATEVQLLEQVKAGNISMAAAQMLANAAGNKAFNDSIQESDKLWTDFLAKLSKNAPKALGAVNNAFENQLATLRRVTDGFISAAEAQENYFASKVIGKGQHFGKGQQSALVAEALMADQVKSLEKLGSKIDSSISSVVNEDVDSSIAKLGKLQESIGKYGEGLENLRGIVATTTMAEDRRRKMLEAIDVHQQKYVKGAMKDYIKGLEQETKAANLAADEAEFKAKVLGLEMVGTQDAHKLIAELTAQREKHALTIKYEADMAAYAAQKKALEGKTDADSLAALQRLNEAGESRTRLFKAETMVGDLQNAQKAVKAELDGPWGKMFQDMANEISDGFKDAFKEGFKEGEGLFRKLMNAFESLFIDMLAELAFQAIAKPIIVPVMQTVGTSIFGLSQGAANTALQNAGMSTGNSQVGLGTVVQGVSTAKDMYNMATGSLGTSFYNAGTSFATSSMGASLGLSAPSTVALHNSIGVMGTGQTAAMTGAGPAALTPAGSSFASGLGTIGNVMPYAAFGSLVGGGIGTATNSKIVGGLAGGAATVGSMGLASAMSVLGTIPVWGWIAAAIVGIIGGMLGTQKESVGPISAGRIGIDNGKATMKSWGTDNEGSSDNAKALGNAAAELFNSVLGVGSGKLNKDAKDYGLVISSFAKDGKFYSELDNAKSQGFDTAEEAIIDGVKRFQDKLVAAGSLAFDDANVVKAMKSSAAKTVEEFVKDLTAAATWTDVQKTTAQGYNPFDEMIKQWMSSAQELGDQMKETYVDLLDRVTNLGLDNAEHAKLLLRQSLEASLGLKDGVYEPLRGMPAVIKQAEINLEALRPTLIALGYDTAMLADFTTRYTQRMRDQYDEGQAITRKSGLLRIRQADSSYKLTGSDVLFSNNIDETKVPNLTTALNGFMLKAGEGTATLADLMDAEGELNKRMYNGKFTAEQYSAVLNSLIEAYKVSKEAAEEAAEALRKAGEQHGERLASLWEKVVEEARNAAEQSGEAWKKVVEDVTERRSTLKTGEYSTLDPYGQFLEAQKRYRELFARSTNTSLAAEERLTAAEQLASAEEAYLKANQDYWASSNPAAFQEVQSGLDQVESVGLRQVKIEEAQLAKLDAILNSLDDGMSSVEDALRESLAKGDFRDYGTGGRGAVNRLIAAALPQYTGGFKAGEFEAWAAANTTVRQQNPNAPYLNSMLTALGADGSRFGLGGWGDPFTRMAEDDPRRIAARELARLFGYTPTFAAGGLHRGGMRLVGERGPELEVTGPARYFNFDQTRELLTNSSERYTSFVGGDGGTDEKSVELLEDISAKLDALIAVSAEAGDGNIEGLAEVVGGIQAVVRNATVESARR